MTKPTQFEQWQALREKYDAALHAYNKASGLVMKKFAALAADKGPGPTKADILASSEALRSLHLADDEMTHFMPPDSPKKPQQP